MTSNYEIVNSTSEFTATILVKATKTLIVKQFHQKQIEQVNEGAEIYEVTLTAKTLKALEKKVNAAIRIAATEEDDE